jgi:hypothetical protein
VAEEHQQACVKTINDFRTKRGATRMVVCCRTDDYERLREPLRTYGTITIQPLTRKQVEDFLARAGEPVAAVRAALAADSSFGELIQSPLLLSIAVLAYRNAPVGTVATGDSSRQLRDRLFTTYVRTMLARRRSGHHSTRQTIRRLAFLADRMKSGNQAVFTLELLDRDAALLYNYNNGLFGSPTMRSSLACGMVGALMLGATGLVAYGWRGGLAGALIGAAVGLPCFGRIDTMYLRFSAVYLNWQAKNSKSPFSRVRDWILKGPSGAAKLGDCLGALWVTLGAAVASGALLGGPEGLVTVVTYGVATAAAVLTAVSLCIGYGYPVWSLLRAPLAAGVLRRDVGLRRRSSRAT